MKNQEKKCSCGCNCGGSIDRRNFMKIAGAGSVALLASKLQAMAGPFENSDFEKLVPADKKLSPEWIKSLYERGTPQVYKGAELKYIGMPVGGICSGQLYLGGDGKLWNWDIFNKHIGTGDKHYAHPVEPASPVEQGFALKMTVNGKTETKTLDKTGFEDISFRGEYPIGKVEYSSQPVSVSLEAFSPFIPLSTDDSSLPATVMRYTVKNNSSDTVEATLFGWLENAVCHNNRQLAGKRLNRIVHGKNMSFLDCSAGKDSAPAAPKRPDIVFEDWKKETYDGWTVEGTAFGTGPIKKTAIAAYQGDVGGDTERVVNSHASAPDGDTGVRDSATGQLTSRKFKIERDFISFWIGGGSHKEKTCLNVLAGGKVVRTATGKNDNKMVRENLDVRNLAGKEACIQIVDNEKGSWGNIGVGKITFSDMSVVTKDLEKLADYGTMGLALLGDKADYAVASAGQDGRGGEQGNEAASTLGEKLVGAIGRSLKLAKGKSATVTFVVTWSFPNLEIGGVREKGRFYATKFDSATAVAKYVAENFERLESQTRLWRDTWYDSTLPYWFLDRTELNTSILATSTCFRLGSGRFWAWEGVGCCAGTCGHVWQYAHAMGRQFPELERILRERTDFGLALQPDGAIFFRGENNNGPAIDAQAGSILRALREHQVSVDDAFLKRIWPGVKRATEWLIKKDENGDGIIESGQHNTLDTDWFGPVAWLSGLYVAALEAAAVMADEMGDAGFAKECREISKRGQENLVAKLFDGEYFINKVDPKHLNAVNSGTGCEIDQVMGQSWAWQVGLGRVLPKKETLSALKSLWRYNFTPDVGPYRAANKPGRWYAMAGEAGLLMCSFPRKDWDYDKAKGQGGGAWAAMYFNECMNGFEYQAAGHMVWEGMVQEGLAVTRAVHDRYNAARRNPWNEVECGDHYARSMASYGVFLAACGFEYHGPKGHIGFAPRLTPENFKAPFTAAEGWGTYEQGIQKSEFRSQLTMKYGKLRVKTIAVWPEGLKQPSKVVVKLGRKKLASQLEVKDGRAIVQLRDEATIPEGGILTIELS